ncbi:DUF4159 domain-containing protein [Paraglaciecola sp. 2405UD69-4]|uniref:DUF4159 domain-containing protein n=1 Tax=Paraglaciecola sp. 2405UD69-4 TaxID=3391836 RepID=UPI0039C9C2BE
MQKDRRQFVSSACALAVTLVLPKISYSQNSEYDFYFTRLSYESGDWEVDERMPANVLNSLIEYTSIRVDIQERIIPLSDPSMLSAPFCYMAGHRLVQFNQQEKKNFKQYVENGGFVFVDDCNHDIDGMFARSFEAEMLDIFGPDALNKIPNDHAIYSSFFEFDGPPKTSIELNGWGDDLVHDYLKAIEINGRIAVLYSNKDLGCEWDYDFRNKRWLREDNTKFAVNIVVYAMTA